MFTLQPLMPTEASRRAYSATGAKVLADVAALKENRPAGIAALDGAVGIVPLIDPADRHGGMGAVGAVMKTNAGCGQAEKGECAIENAALVAASDHGKATTPFEAVPIKPVAVWLEIVGDRQIGIGLANLIDSA